MKEFTSIEEFTSFINEITIELKFSFSLLMDDEPSFIFKIGLP